MPAKKRAKTAVVDSKPDRKYELASFWDDRYSKRKDKKHQCEEGGCWHDGATDDFLANEWYYTYNDIKPLLQPFLRATAKKNKDGVELLDLGCGISTFFEELREDGHAGHWVGVDFSGEAVRQMRETYPLAKYPSWDFVEADVRRMHTLASQSFDIIIDKALSDALICDVKQGKEALRRTYSEVNRLLKPGGLFVVVSLYSPEKDDDRWFLELLTESFLAEPAELDTSPAPELVPIDENKTQPKRGKPRRKSTTSSTSAPASLSSTASDSSSSSPSYKLKIIIHSSSEDDDEENDGGDNPNWMSSRYVYTLQKCRTSGRTLEPYSIEHRIH